MFDDSTFCRGNSIYNIKRHRETFAAALEDLRDTDLHHRAVTDDQLIVIEENLKQCSIHFKTIELLIEKMEVRSDVSTSEMDD